MQLMGTLAAFFVPVNMGNFTIQSLGDPANPTDALNLRTGDTRYMRSGGPIIAPPGTAPTDVGLGVGDASTGLYRQGTSLAIAALGDVHMLFNANRTAQLHVAAGDVRATSSATLPMRRRRPCAQRSAQRPLMSIRCAARAGRRSCSTSRSTIRLRQTGHG